MFYTLFQSGCWWEQLKKSVLSENVATEALELGTVGSRQSRKYCHNKILFYLLKLPKFSSLMAIPSPCAWLQFNSRLEEKIKTLVLSVFRFLFLLEINMSASEGQLNLIQQTSINHVSTEISNFIALTLYFSVSRENICLCKHWRLLLCLN